MSFRSSLIVMAIVIFVQLIGVCQYFPSGSGWAIKNGYIVEIFITFLICLYTAYLPVVGTFIAINGLSYGFHIPLWASVVLYIIPGIFSLIQGFALLIDVADFILYWIARDMRYASGRIQINSFKVCLCSTFQFITGILIFIYFVSNDVTRMSF